MKSFRVLIVVGLFISISCRQKPAPTLFELKKYTGINFSNDIHNTKEFNIFSYRNFYNGAGVAIGDINNDGLSDIFFTANMGSNKLYLNKGDWKFDDISEKAGITEKNKWNTGVVMADINSDGWLDIYVCNAGYDKSFKGHKNVLFINNHDLTFREAAAEYGLDQDGYTTHAAFFDYDLDGDLDAYILNNSFIPVNTLNYSNKRDLRARDWPVQDFLKGGGDKFLRNDNGKYIDISEQAGVYGSLIGFGLGVTVGDVNGDHYPDIYVSNDFFERDYLYINQKNGTFSEELEKWMQHSSLSSMGADMADVNNDGSADIFVTDMLPDDDYRLKTTTSFESIDVYRLKVRQGFYHQFTQNTLQINNKCGKFVETGFYSGVAASDWSWGALIFDADNDGLSDIYICNGIYHDVTDQDFIDFFADEVIQKMVLTGEKEQVDNIVNKMPSHPLPKKTFKNMGGLKFSDVGDSWGLSQPSFSNGSAYGDLDNDGDLDLVVNNINDKAFVYRNNSRESAKGLVSTNDSMGKNNFISILLKGKGQNSFAVGSTIKIYQGDQIISRQVIPSRGFQSSVDYKTVIGLGTKPIDSLIIIWPDRTYSKFDKPSINTSHSIQQPGEGLQLPQNHVEYSPLLDSVKNNFEKHEEDDFIDFYHERNLPMMVSKEGPKVAHGDVNGDGLIDIYIGGAVKNRGQLYLQTTSGFNKKQVPDFEKFTETEDVAVIFFDADMDKDLDLFIGAGGNNHPPNSKKMQHRLFRNDGKGNFEIDTAAFSSNDMNIAVAVANDFDKDGDQDLFVGGRSAPYNYGIAPQSYLYVNNGKGQFSDMAATKNPDIAKIGLVTGATWANVAGDQAKELIIVGEWMAPRIFSFNGDRFVEAKTNLADLLGWWKTVVSDDLDKDGDQDLILGNLGENFYLKPDAQHPVRIWISDFDRNGTVEKIITRTVDGKDKPVFLKRELTEQIVSLKKQNLRYTEFARKSIQELFGPELMKNATVREFNYPSSCIALNEGNGKFFVKKLPAMVQLSSVNATYCTDLNYDGHIDLVLGGNQFEFQPQFSRLDASFGHVLINKGNAEFDWIPQNQSGIELNKEIRDIAEIPGKNSRYILILQNNDFPALFLIKKKSSEK